MRFSEARLHAESSTCMYSEHGFDALMRPEFGDVCHWLIVVSYWTPGSAQRHAASAISRISSRASIGSPIGSPVVRAIRCHSLVVLDGVHELVGDADRVVGVLVLDRRGSRRRRSTCRSPRRARASALSSSLALHQMNSRMSGWSTSRTTIFAARRVLPPDLIVPAHESAPRMNETGPDAVPPLLSGSIEPRMFERLMPEPEPPRKIRPSRVFQSRIDSIVSSTLEDEAGRALRLLLEAHVEPHGRVEGRHLVQQDVASARPRRRRRPRPWRSSRAARPQSAIVPATRPIICLTERSRAGESSCPRKYFWATMLVAFCDHVFGNSTSSCSKATRSPWPMRASRSSHSTVSNGWTPGVVNRRPTDSAFPAWLSCANAVCGESSIVLCSSRTAAAPRMSAASENLCSAGVDEAPTTLGRNRRD